MSLRYAVVGTGAVGGYYGARLQQGGAEVHFLLHRDYDHVLKSGLVVQSIAGDFVLPQVQAHCTTATMPPVDVVVIGLKTTQNALLPNLLPPLLGPKTAILTLQNGFGIEAELAAWVGDRPILGGLCVICANKVGPGAIRHLDYGNLLLGQHRPDHQPAGISPLLEQIVQDFAAGQVTVDKVEDLRLARWRKLLWNIPFNGLSVVMAATTDEMMADPNIRQLAEWLMADVLEAAQHDGDTLSPGQNRHLPPALVAQMLAHTEQMTPYRTSMKIDFDEGRPLEVEAIYGNALRTAQAAGATVPRIEMLYHWLKAIDRRRGKG
ncbi:putative 2-dehydropantoate 2-reductase [Phormidium tenue]|uniref:2-dehydropantoate 2-reductase n=1 Tax=Phormidium tenue NIES-30 TaxID=549789 RepID=A0A1U7J0I5_9CYAN|nr:putative 2-dehydropantoate 2-reductase [Phormidium tenue]MBD2234245.1 putative 2-dehydropantoate 2-reductase [Phormidium tenue FACHB-1052]OKH45179.1 2-dehydropantoate 2-reductase [Phormidium tenue NIES-30]